MIILFIFASLILNTNGMDKEKILIKGAGILNAEIIMSALQEYATICNYHGNYFRAKAVSELIDRIDFEPFDCLRNETNISNNG